MALTLTGMLAVGQTYIVLGLTDPMATDLAVPASAIGTATTVFGIAYACGFLAAGPLAGRFGAKPVLVAGLVCASAATLAAALPASFSGELAVRAVQGFVTASFAPCALVYAAQQLPVRMRTAATAALTTAFLASAIVMPLVAGPAADAWGWRGVFVAGAAALAGCAVILALTLVRGPAAHEPLVRAFLVLPAVVRRGRMLALYLATAAVLGGYVMLFTALQLSGSPAVAAFPGGLQGLRIATLPALVLATLAAGILHRVTPRRRAATGFVAAAVSALAVVVDATPVLAGGVIVFAASIALTAPALVARIVEIATPTEVAGATAWYGAFMFLGGSVGPLLAAPAHDGGLTVVVVIVTALMLLGAVLVSAVRGAGPERDSVSRSLSREASVVA